jgi:hypothetical protein
MLIPNDMSLTKLCLDSSLFKAKLFVRRNYARFAASSRYLSFRSDRSNAGVVQAAFRSNAYRAVSS